MWPSHLFCRLLTVSIIFFLSQPSSVFLHLFCAQSLVLSSFASTSIFQVPQVAEYLLFVESTFRFHTTQHSKQMLSPYISSSEGWGILPWGHFPCWKPLFPKQFAFLYHDNFYSLRSPNFRGNKIVGGLHVHIMFLAVKCSISDHSLEQQPKCWSDGDFRRKMLDYLPAHYCKRNRLFSTSKNPERRLYDNYHRERDANLHTAVEHLYMKYLQICWDKPYYGYTVISSFTPISVFFHFLNTLLVVHSVDMHIVYVCTCMIVSMIHR